MAYLITDTPLVPCFVRAEFLRDDAAGHGEFEEGYIFGTTALEGRAPAFTVMLANGAQFTRLPLHAFCMKPCDPLPLTTLCLWDALSYHVAVHAFAYLKTLHCDVRCGDGVWRPGGYLFTLDWAEGAFSELPDQHKSHHLIALDEGQIAAMPNNRLRWHDPSWIKPFADPPDYRVQTRVFLAERTRALVDGSAMFYRQEGEG